MLNKDDRDRLQEALDWVGKKDMKDDVRAFVFSSEGSACEAAKELCEAAKTLAKGVKVECLGLSVTVTRPRDPGMAKSSKRIWEMNC